MELITRPGRVTLLALLATPKGFLMTAAGGESLGGPPRIPGSPHTHFRPDFPLERFFEVASKWGIGHHCAVVHGNVVPHIEALARMLGVELLVLK
jgi:L-arabinose isomerase